MQRTWVRPLVQEDPTCFRATKPEGHNYWASQCSTTRETKAMRGLCTTVWESQGAAAVKTQHSPQINNLLNKQTNETRDGRSGNLTSAHVSRENVNSNTHEPHSSKQPCGRGWERGSLPDVPGHRKDIGIWLYRGNGLSLNLRKRSEIGPNDICTNVMKLDMVTLPNLMQKDRTKYDRIPYVERIWKVEHVNWLYTQQRLPGKTRNLLLQ